MNKEIKKIRTSGTRTTRTFHIAGFSWKDERARWCLNEMKISSFELRRSSSVKCACRRSVPKAKFSLRTGSNWKRGHLGINGRCVFVGKFQRRRTFQFEKFCQKYFGECYRKLWKKIVVKGFSLHVVLRNVWNVVVFSSVSWISLKVFQQSENSKKKIFNFVSNRKS